MNENQPRHDEPRGSLALLGVHEPDRVRDARVRGRCHVALEKRRRREVSVAWAAWRRGFEPVIVSTLCAVYLIEVLSRAIQLYQF